MMKTQEGAVCSFRKKMVFRLLLLVALAVFCYNNTQKFQALIKVYDSMEDNEQRTLLNPTTEKRACRVVIENKPDFHHEVLESVVLRYPLPWHKFNCDITKPIIYEFALHQNRFHLNIGVEKTLLSKKANHINETEFWGWYKYFNDTLQHKVFDRNDGSGVRTKAYFNDIKSYEQLDNLKIDAVIDASCDVYGNFLQRLKSENERYCLLHGSNANKLPTWPEAYNRSCFLSPMWPENVCKFLATDLPSFNDPNDDEGYDTMKGRKEVWIFVHAGSFNLEMVSKLFHKLPIKEYNVSVHMMGRESTQITNKYGINSHVHYVKELDFVNYYKYLNHCDIVFILYDPIRNHAYFPSGGKKSSGIIPAVVKYKIPSVMHYEFAKIYQPFFTAPVEVYNETEGSKMKALEKMIIQVYGDEVKS